MDRPDRRTFVRSAVLVLGTGIAGCTGGGGGDSDGDDGTDANGGGDDSGTDGDDAGAGDDADTGGEVDGDGADEDAAGMVVEYPAVEEWLTGTSVGGADGSYGGTIADERGSDTVTVDVGAEGNGGGFAYGPSAVAVSPGATVEWEWTGEGNPHNVAAQPGEQLGESDFEFGSGDAVSGSGVQYSQTFEETGVALYYCDPHLALGMKGALVVAE